MIFQSQQDYTTFQQAMQNYQKGEWSEGHALLETLMERDPLNSELRTLKNEMLVREKFEVREVDENRQLLKRKIFTTFLWIILGAAVIAAVFFVLVNYSRTINNTADQIRENTEKLISQNQLEFKVRNARSLLQSNNYVTAKQILLEVKAADPKYPDIDVYISQADELEKYDLMYQQANQFYDDKEFQKAYDLYTQIDSWRKNYLDVTNKLDELERGFLEDELFAKAEDAFVNQQWEVAITNYEQIRSIDQDYHRTEVEEHLFESYISAAEAVISQDTQSMAALDTAEVYFKKALSLRPQDQETRIRRAKARKAFEVRLANSYVEAAQKTLVESADSIDALNTAESYLAKAVDLVPGDQSIRIQHDLAVKYLQAMDSFAAAGWDDVITLLEEVIKNDPKYASYTAAQALYEAYMARARNSLAGGLFDSSLTDLRKAVETARIIPNAIMQEFEAQRWIADVYGLQGQYEDAVGVYKVAIQVSDFGILVQKNKPELSTSLLEATNQADAGKFKEAYFSFREILNQSLDIYGRVDYVVAVGDYLPQIARRYNTTIQSILDANKVQATTALNRQLLIIPVFPNK